MRYASRLRRATPTAHTRRGRRIVSRVSRAALSFVGALALVAAGLVTTATLATAIELLPTTVPTLLVGWAAAIGLAFALPIVAVRSVVAVIERLQ